MRCIFRLIVLDSTFDSVWFESLDSAEYINRNFDCTRENYWCPLVHVSWVLFLKLRKFEFSSESFCLSERMSITQMSPDKETLMTIANEAGLPWKIVTFLLENQIVVNMNNLHLITMKSVNPIQMREKLGHIWFQVFEIFYWMVQFVSSCSWTIDLSWEIWQRRAFSHFQKN